MPAAIVSYFEKLWAVKNSPVGLLMIAVVFVGMVMHPAGPEIY